MKLPLPNPQKKNKGSPPSQWRWLLWYAILTLVMLWAWQDAAHKMAVETIPYSQFKAYLRRGEVVECSVKKTEIVGKIQPRANASSETRQSPTAAKKQTPAETTSKSTQAPEVKVPTEAKAPAAAEPKAETGRSEAKSSAAPQAFDFRTVRVDDPDLVNDLEKAGVKFTGVQPGFMSEFLWAWILPIGLIAVVWWFLSRKMKGMGQSVLSFGASHAKLAADTDIKVTFNDVAGCEEAKY